MAASMAYRAGGTEISEKSAHMVSQMAQPKCRRLSKKQNSKDKNDSCGPISWGQAESKSEVTEPERHFNGADPCSDSVIAHTKS